MPDFEQPLAGAAARVSIEAPRLSLQTIAICVGLAVQTATAVWWASGVDRRLVTVERVVAPLSDGTLTATLARIDERTGSMKDRLNKLSDRFYSSEGFRSSDDRR